MRKTFFAVVLATAVSVALLCAGCNDSGVAKVNGEAEAFLGRFSGSGGNGSGGDSGNTSDTFKDSRDGKTYKKVKIGNQTWMAQNLNYQTSSGSWCYDNNTSNCNTYGRLYNYNAAENACPSGWHLPTEREWEILETRAGGEKAGLFLKARTGWNSGGNGEDDFGFTALSGGYRNDEGNFDGVGSDGIWRISGNVIDIVLQEGYYCSHPEPGYQCWWYGGYREPHTIMKYDSDVLMWYPSYGYDGYAYQSRSYVNGSSKPDFDNSKSWGLSIRCVKDE
jgi:uncharacterized protein (TIGR02145 family)